MTCCWLKYQQQANDRKVCLPFTAYNQCLDEISTWMESSCPEPKWNMSKAMLINRGQYFKESVTMMYSYLTYSHDQSMQPVSWGNTLWFLTNASVLRRNACYHFHVAWRICPILEDYALASHIRAFVASWLGYGHAVHLGRKPAVFRKLQLSSIGCCQHFRSILGTQFP